MRHRHFLRLLLTSLLCLSVLLTLAWTPFFFHAPAVLAHAFVIGSDPVDGSTIGAAPTTIRIFFNADISPASIAHVYAFAPGGPTGGRLVDGGRSTISANNARELDTPLLSPSTLPQGSFEVKWTAIATDDGHAAHGLIGFNVGYSVTGLSGTPILGPITSNILPQLNLTANGSGNYTICPSNLSGDLSDILVNGNTGSTSSSSSTSSTISQTICMFPAQDNGSGSTIGGRRIALRTYQNRDTVYPSYQSYNRSDYIYSHNSHCIK